LSRSERFIPDPSSISRLLGRLYRANGDLRSAASCFVSALEVDPFMWDVFTDLCDCGQFFRDSVRLFFLSFFCSFIVLTCGSIGIPLNAANVFKFKPTPIPKEHHSHPPALANEDASFSKRDDPNEIDTEDRAYRSARGATSKFLPNTNLTLSTKRKQPSGLDVFAPDMEGFHAPASRKENPGSNGSVMTQRRSARLNQTTSATLTDRRTTEPNAKQDAFKRPEKQSTVVHPTTRRLATLKRRMNAPRSSDTVAGQDTKIKNDRLTSNMAEPKHSTEFPNEAISRDQDKLQPLVQLFASFGTAYYHLRRFQPQICLDTLASLPAEQQATAWVISKIARSQYELQSYKEAKATFQVLRKVAPSWVEELEIYSTVLWHLNDDVELAFHAHELTDSHFLAPQTWCAVGNSFSLQKAHPDAIKCFKRATQLQPQLAHSYSLLGHECIDAEQYDEAVTAFHRALQVDARFGRSWSGARKAG
ncbi:hypothetical protein IL306_002876, partial [Fusarium sp. DS 682]